MKTLSWAAFIAAFIFASVASQFLSEIAIRYLYERTFPIIGLRDYFSAGYMVPLMFVAWGFYLAIIIKSLDVAPNFKAGSLVALIFTVSIYAITYYKHFDTKDGIRIFMDSSLIILLSYTSFKKNEN